MTAADFARNDAADAILEAQALFDEMVRDAEKNSPKLPAMSAQNIDQGQLHTRDQV